MVVEPVSVRQAGERVEPREVRKVFLGALALGDVLHRSHHLDRIAADRVVHDARQFLDDSFGFVRANYSMLDALARAVVDRPGHFLTDASPVIRMHGLEEILVRYLDLARLIAEDSKGLVRPPERVLIQVAQIAEVALPAPEERDALRRREAL